MSASTSSSVLETLLRGGRSPVAEIRALGEESPGDFFRTVIESLADSFDPAQSEAYDYVMQAWDLHRSAPPSVIPDRVDTVYILSRVTLGADIKITSMILDAMKRRFPESRIVFVAGRKSIELFEADRRLEFLEATYPRIGPVSARIAFGNDLRERLATPNSIVVDPDSRMTQLGMIGSYLHFPSRTEGSPEDNLTDITGAWLGRTFGISATVFVLRPTSFRWIAKLRPPQSASAWEKTKPSAYRVISKRD